MRGHARLAALSLPLVLIALAGLLAPWLAPYGPNSTDLAASLRPPDPAHWLGTDQLGRDQLSRIMWAARTSMTVTAAVMAISFVVGVAVGALGAYAGGIVDRVVTWSIELALSVPSMLLALAILGIRGNSVANLVLALSLFAWAAYARIARGAVLGYRGSAASDALVGLGAHPVRIVTLHVIPIAARPALVFASTDIGAVVLATAGLSFLGLGIAPPTPEWGQMLVESRPYLASAWWLSIPPGIALTAVAFSSNLISEHLGLAPELRRWRLRRTPPARTPEPASRGPLRAAGAQPLLRARGLQVEFDTPHGGVTAVHGLDYEVRPGEVLALVGESGSGKTASVLGPLGLLGETARVGGSVTFDGVELVGAPPDVLRGVRGSGVAVVFQDPYAALNPLRTIGSVVGEALRPAGAGAQARARVVDLLAAVGLPRPDVLVDRYPHELSGGMRQRVLIAAALAGDPAVVVADEPTTALDVTLQAEILALLRELGRERGLAMVLISHDLAVVADVADRVLVLYDGRAMESAPAGRLIAAPLHPYTQGLLNAVPVLGRPTGTRFATLPDPGAASGGCTFATRCRQRVPSCLTGPVPVLQAGPGHAVACPPALDRHPGAAERAC